MPVWSASSVVQEAQTLINAGQFDQALQRLDSHLSSAPQDAEARFTRGLVLVRLNRTDDAIKAFTELTRDYPQLPEPYNNLAVIYAQQGDYEKSRDALEAALATHPSYGVAHENLGDIYAALAAAAYNRALTLDQNNPSARAKLNLINQLDSLADSGAAVRARSKPTEPAADAAAAAAKLDTAALGQLVKDWAAAWAAKDADKYLGFYAAEFAPEGGASRQAWEAQRRVRIAKPKSIAVSATNVQYASLGEGKARVSFDQEYSSDVLTNRSTKVLEIKNVQGAWRIVREYSR